MPRKNYSRHLRFTVSENSLNPSRVSPFPADGTRQTSEHEFEDQGDQFIAGPVFRPRPPGRRSKSKVCAPDDSKDTAETDDRGPIPQRYTVDEAKHPLINAMHTMDGAKMLKSPVNNRTSDLTAELNYSKNLYVMENAELQKLRESSEEKNLALRKENVDLKKQVKKLGSTMDDLDTVRDRIQVARKALDEHNSKSAQLESCRLQLERQNDSIRDKIEILKGDLSILKPKRKKDKAKIQHLNRCVGLLQYQDKKAQSTLLHTDKLIQRKISQIEEMQSHIAESVSRVHLFRERVTDVKDRIAEANNAGKEDENCESTEKDNDSSVKHRKRPPTLAEEIAQAEQCVQVVEKTKAVEVAAPSAPTQSWIWGSLLGGLQKAAYHAAMLVLTAMVLASMIPACQDGPCPDLLHNTTRGFLKPYCNMDFTAPIPL